MITTRQQQTRESRWVVAVGDGGCMHEWGSSGGCWLPSAFLRALESVACLGEGGLVGVGAAGPMHQSY